MTDETQSIHGVPQGEASLFLTMGVTPDEARDWVSIGIGPINARHYRSAKISPAIAKKWLAAGVASGREAATYKRVGLSIDDALKWAGQGFSLGEIQDFRACSINLEDALAWKAIGVGADEAQSFLSMQVEYKEAKAWAKRSFTASQAANYREAHLSPVQASKWRAIEERPGLDALWFVEAGFSLAEAKEWVITLRLNALGMSSERVKPLMGVAFSLEEADLLIRGSVSDGTALLLRDQGFTPEESVATVSLKRKGPWPTRARVAHFEGRGLAFAQAFKLADLGNQGADIRPLVDAEYSLDESEMLIEGGVSPEAAVALRRKGFTPEESISVLQEKKTGPWPTRNKVAAHEAWGCPFGEAFQWIAGGVTPFRAARFAARSVGPADAIECLERNVLPSTLDAMPRSWSLKGKLDWLFCGGTPAAAREFGSHEWPADDVRAAILPDDLGAFVNQNAPKLNERASLWVGKRFLSGRIELWQVLQEAGAWRVESWTLVEGATSWNKKSKKCKATSLLESIQVTPELSELTSAAVVRFELATADLHPADLAHALTISGQAPDVELWEESGLVNEWFDEANGYVPTGPEWRLLWTSVSTLFVDDRLWNGGHEGGVFYVEGVDVRGKGLMPFLVHEYKIVPRQTLAESSWFSESGGAPISWDGGNSISLIADGLLQFRQWGDSGEYENFVDLPNSNTKLAGLLAEWVDEMGMTIISALRSEQLDPRRTLSVEDRAEWDELIGSLNLSCWLEADSDVLAKVQQQLRLKRDYQFIMEAMSTPEGKAGHELYRLLRAVDQDGVLGRIMSLQWDDNGDLLVLSD